MGKQKITLHEPDGPLRSGLMAISKKLGPAGGDVFAQAHALANRGLEVVLAMHHTHRLGDPDNSIPPPYKAVGIQRERGQFDTTGAVLTTTVARM